MITIKFLGASHHPHLLRSADDEAWLRTPIGMVTRAGSGPAGATCYSCAHLDLLAGRWSDYGRACRCRERQRLTPGKKVQEVPVRTPACSSYQRRPHAAMAPSPIDSIDERILEKTASCKHLETMVERVKGQIEELKLERASAANDELA